MQQASAISGTNALNLVPKQDCLDLPGRQRRIRLRSLCSDKGRTLVNVQTPKSGLELFPVAHILAQKQQFAKNQEVSAGKDEGKWTRWRESTIPGSRIVNECRPEK